MENPSKWPETCQKRGKNMLKAMKSLAKGCFEVLGAMPAPRSLCESSPKTDLTLDTLHLGGLSAETTSTILAFLLDLRSTRP